MDDVSLPPLHMDKYSRNARLYEFLTQMGHVVSPIFAEDSNDKIESIHVSVSLSIQDITQCTPKTSITPVMQRSKVGDIIGSSENFSSGVVIKFPTIV